MENIFANFDLVLRAFLLTIELGVVAAVVSLVVGTLLAAARVGPIPVLAKAGALYVTLVRNTPLLIVFIFVYATVFSAGMLYMARLAIKGPVGSPAPTKDKPIITH